MGNWYVVVKTIRGNRYRYRQRSERFGPGPRDVRTYSEYLGRADGGGDGATESKTAPVNTYIGRAIGVQAPEIPRDATLDAMRRVQNAERAEKERKAWNDPVAKRLRALQRERRAAVRAIGKASGREFVANQNLKRMDVFQRYLTNAGREQMDRLAAAVSEQKHFRARCDEIGREQELLERNRQGDDCPGRGARD